MSRFDDLVNGFLGTAEQNPGEESRAQTLSDLWDRIRRMTPGQAVIAAPVLFVTAGMAVLGLLAAAIFGAATLVLLEFLLGDDRPRQRPGFTYH